MADQLTIEQRRAIAMATARARMTAASVMKPPPPRPTLDEIQDPNNPTESVRAGMGQWTDEILDGLTQLYLKAKGDDKALAGHEENVAEKRRLDEPLKESTEGFLGGLTAEGAATALPFTKAVQGAQMLRHPINAFKNMRQAGRGIAGPGMRTVPASAGGRLALGTAGAGGAGAGFSALGPTIGEEERGDRALFGFGAGAGGNLVGAGAGRLISGLVPRSRSAGMVPPGVADEATLGQVADRESLPGRIFSRYEESLTSVPGVGSIVANARKRGQDAWRQELVNRVSPTGFKPDLSTGTRDAMADITDEYRRRYTNAFAGTTVKADPMFEAEVMNIVADPKYRLVGAEQKRVLDHVVNMYNDFLKGQNEMTGQAAKDFESWLSAAARDKRGTDEAKAWSAIEKAWTKSYQPQLPAASVSEIKLLDKTYAPFKTTSKAAGALSNEFGDFTPPQLLSAVKARSTPDQFSQGQGMLQQDAQAGRYMFGDKLPDSGTSERAMSSLLTKAPEILAGGAVAPLMTTKAGRNLMTGDTAFQRMLQRLRAQEAARNYLGPASYSLTDSE